MKIPIAEEWLKSLYNVNSSSEVALGGKQLTDKLVEFAKLYVEEVLKQESEKAKIKYEYKIYNKLTKKYVNRGYAQKATWKRFPKEQIDELDNNHEIHRFEYSLIKLTKLNLEGNEI